MKSAAPADTGLPCAYDDRIARYNTASRTLSLSGCYLGQPLARAVTLTPADGSALVQRVSALTAEGPSSACGTNANADVQTLTVDAGDGETRRYASTAYRDCGDSGVDAAFIDAVDLGNFIASVFAYASACDADTDAGLGTEAAPTCLPPDGGSDAGGNDATRGDARDGNASSLTAD